jgi:secreted trypsin-like serine protease
MKLFKAALIAIFFSSFSAQALVNSTEVSDEQFADEFPWAVAVEHPLTGGICGGVLIAPDWVLSAAHCTGKRKHILVGNADRTKAKRIKVVRSIRHPNFNKDTLQYDIGLMQLAEPVDMPVVPLPSDAEARTLLFNGRTAELAGWGRIEKRKGAVERLRTGEVRLNRLTLSGTSLVYDYEGGGPCSLDSGGPMLMRTIDGRRFLIGVASATVGPLCKTNGGMAFYTNIVTVRPFILKHVDGIE